MDMKSSSNSVMNCYAEKNTFDLFKAILFSVFQVTLFYIHSAVYFCSDVIKFCLFVYHFSLYLSVSFGPVVIPHSFVSRSFGLDKVTHLYDG